MPACDPVQAPMLHPGAAPTLKGVSHDVTVFNWNKDSRHILTCTGVDDQLIYALTVESPTWANAHRAPELLQHCQGRWMLETSGMTLRKSWMLQMDSPYQAKLTHCLSYKQIKVEPLRLSDRQVGF